jgi:hypothetical protein
MSVNARTSTVGSNIVFQRDIYDPGSDAGRHMLAHELTRVVQQRNGPVDGSDAGGGIRVSDSSDRLEREAVANVDHLMSDRAPTATLAAPAVRRQADEEEVQTFIQRQEAAEEQDGEAEPE